MKQLFYDMLYLVTCAIHEEIPDGKRFEGTNLEALHRVCRMHFLEAIAGTALKSAEVTLPEEWEQTLSKAIRKNILFDMERKKLLNFFEEKGIWYMPLKGVVLKELYPAVGLRQMSDNDILVDKNYMDEIRQFMLSQGYKAAHFGVGTHDVYEKAPVFNFEIHRSLYGSAHEEAWVNYYETVKERLLKTEGSGYGYRFSDEDFYVYMITHEYKHYTGSGTGLRSLLDVYLYLTAKENLDFTYICRECEKLGVAEFEEQGRKLCKKVFSKESLLSPVKETLTEDELTMLEFYLHCGVYGTKAQNVKSGMKRFAKETGSTSKFRYLVSRIFPCSKAHQERYPFFFKYKIFLPVYWIGRGINILFHKKRRKNAVTEIKIIL